MKSVLVAALIVTLSITVNAQEFRGTISGTVSDPAGAVIVNAKVTAVETSTNTKVQTVSDSSGQYALPFLAPGRYELTVESSGFRQAVQSGIQLGSGDHPVIDVKLAVGDTSQKVLVTDEAPMVNTENASTGQSITSAQVEELPLDGRTPMMLAQLSMGVISTTQPSLVHPFDSAAPAALSIGGLPSQTSELLMDGSPDATWDLRLAYSPMQDAVQQVIVKAFDNDAAYGHTGSGTANMILKTGTNQFHGTLWEFNQPDNLSANTYFNNKSGVPTPVTHLNEYGLTASGPVFIPKVYDGRNKLFWYFGWENFIDSQPNTTLLTVPTAAERTGDFSALLPAGSQYQLYNPYTATQSGSTVTRAPFAGNVIPPSLISPIAAAYMQYYPQPNVTSGVGPTGVNNYISNATTNDNFVNFLGRTDYNMSDRSRLLFDTRYTNYSQVKNDYFSNISNGSILIRQNWGATLDEVYTITPRTVLDIRANFTRMNEGHGVPSQGLNPTTLGFPSYFAGSSNYSDLPVIALTTYQPLGANSANLLPSQSGQLFGDVVTVRGNHTLKLGVDLRQYRLNVIQYGNSTGTFTFGNTYDRASSSASSTVAQGQDLASFLLGLPTSGSYDINTYSSLYSYYFAGFVQDDWRVTHTLTVNLGLRFDSETPYTEKYGRTVNGFNTSTPNPLAAAAIAAYAKSPTSLLPAAEFNVNGGLTFASPSNGGEYQVHTPAVSPRVGVAWSPAIFHGTTVVRAGFGMFVAPVTVANLGTNGTYSTNPLINQEGFSATTSFSIPGAIVTPTNPLSNPFPTGLLAPAGAAAGLATFEGQTLSFLDPDMKNPYSLRWNLNLQRNITPTLLVEAGYVGNHAVHLPVSVTQLNGIPRQFLSTLPLRDAAVNTALTASVANPFSGLNTSLNTTTTTVAQLLAPYPEFPVGTSASGDSGSTGIVEQNLSIGSSYFEAMMLRVEKRLSHGLSLTGNYTFSHLIEEDSWLNAAGPTLEKRISPFDHTNHFVIAATYELPIGKGKAVDLGSKWANTLVGGWMINNIYTYQTGAPILWTNGSSTSPGDYVYFGGPGALAVNPRETNVASFNTALFDTNSTQAFSYHIRTFSTTFPNVRSDGINQLDTSLLKRFAVTEHASLQLRFEAFNLLNRAAFSAPSTTVSSSGFGLITAQANRSRTIQLGARLVF
jgi:hypothetical protein